MEGNKVVVGDNGDTKSSNRISGGTDGLPPKPLTAVYGHCLTSKQTLSAAPCKKSLARHPSLVKKKRKRERIQFCFLFLFFLNLGFASPAYLKIYFFFN